jgi:hypothetical protein
MDHLGALFDFGAARAPIPTLNAKESSTSRLTSTKRVEVRSLRHLGGEVNEVFLDRPTPTQRAGDLGTAGAPRRCFRRAPDGVR